MEREKQKTYCDHNWYVNAGETKRWCSHCDKIEKLNSFQDKPGKIEEIKQSEVAFDLETNIFADKINQIIRKLNQSI